MRNIFKNRFLAFVLIGLFLIGCTALMVKYNPWYKNPDCTLLADLQPPVTDGFIYDKLGDRNPCALEHGMIFAVTGAVYLTSATAQEVYEWAEQARKYLADGVNGEDFTNFVAEQLEKIFGPLGKVVVWIGEGLRVIPKDEIISAGDAQVLDHIFVKVQDKMGEFMGMAMAKEPGGVPLNELKF